MNTKEITVPLSVWGRLASEADNQGISVEDLLVAAINRVIHPEERTPMIVTAVYAGYTDGEIAAATGETRQHVAMVRRRAGLPANRDRGQRRLIPYVGARA